MAKYLRRKKLPFSVIEGYARAGLPLGQIVEKTGIPLKVVKFRLKQMGWQMKHQPQKQALELIPPDPDFRPSKYADEDVPLIDLIALCAKHKTINEIAEYTNKSPNYISKRLRDAGYHGETLENYKKYKADLMDLKGLALLDSIDSKVIEKMSGRDRLIGVGILTDKSRLERGEATEIVDVRLLQESLEEIRRRRKNLENKLREAQIIDVESKEEPNAISIRKTEGSNGDSTASPEQIVQKEQGSSVNDKVPAS